MEDLDEINRIRKFFQENKVKMIKMNHSFDSDVQRFSQFDGYIQLSKDGKYLEMTNKKPSNNPKYILEADPDTIAKEQKEHQEHMKKKLMEFKLKKNGNDDNNIQTSNNETES